MRPEFCTPLLLKKRSELPFPAQSVRIQPDTLFRAQRDAAGKAGMIRDLHKVKIREFGKETLDISFIFKG